MLSYVTCFTLRWPRIQIPITQAPMASPVTRFRVFRACVLFFHCASSTCLMKCICSRLRPSLSGSILVAKGELVGSFGVLSAMSDMRHGRLSRRRLYVTLSYKWPAHTRWSWEKADAWLSDLRSITSSIPGNTSVATILLVAKIIIFLHQHILNQCISYLYSCKFNPLWIFCKLCAF